uniref:Uncharacterized protein n=1 Tax=Rhizophora mucronata TaxID=61149 RepID=A0A2P2Q8F0_RHIMU
MYRGLARRHDFVLVSCFAFLLVSDFTLGSSLIHHSLLLEFLLLLETIILKAPRRFLFFFMQVEAYLLIFSGTVSSRMVTQRNYQSVYIQNLAL